jgi:amino acid adenylation domain-containing protein
VSARLLHELLAASAEAHPNRTAVVDGGRRATYAELEARANRLANLLLDLGVSAGDRIGLYREKQLESLVGIYGALKVGAAYVPLDPQAPAARLAYISSDCDIRVILTGEEKAGTWAGLVAAGSPLETLVLLTDGGHDAVPAPDGVRVVTSSALEGQPETASPTKVDERDLAYILYTSGSTGDPKGVMLSHRNALAFVDWAVDCFDVNPEDRLSSHAPLHFDLSIFDLFAAAKACAPVVLVPPVISMFPAEVVRFIGENEISIWYSVPTILSMLTLRGGLAGGEFPQLRTILFAGEVFPTKYLRRLMELLPHVRFYNLYGPTETNVCTYYEVRPLPAEQTEPIPIGRAITNVDVFAVTEDGRVAAPGEVGELYVRGPTVMRGYWGDPLRTGKVLVRDPSRGESDEYVYRTGDLVQEDENGSYRFLGRRDTQIKSRGYRIELGDVESTLVTHPAVVECAVIAVPDELITNRIRAFVAVREKVVQEADLVRFCAERIPHYMIPESFEFRDVLPRTSTGKIDRQALQSSGRTALPTTREPRAPR